MIDLLDKTMWNYIIKDIGKELEYLPYGECKIKCVS